MGNKKGFSVFHMNTEQRKLFEKAIALDSNIRIPIIRRVLRSLGMVTMIWLREKKTVYLYRVGRFHTGTRHRRDWRPDHKGEVIAYEHVYFNASRGLKMFLKGRNNREANDTQIPSLIKKADEHNLIITNDN